MSVEFETRDGTLVANNGDYIPVAGKLTFAPGEVQKSIRVIVQHLEQATDLFVDLFSPINALLANSRVRGSAIEDAVGDRVPGDVNADLKVDFGDFLILSSNFGKADVSLSEGDLNEDGRVSFADFLLLSAHFGESAVAAVAADVLFAKVALDATSDSEPASVSMLEDDWTSV